MNAFQIERNLKALVMQATLPPAQGTIPMNPAHESRIDGYPGSPTLTKEDRIIKPVKYCICKQNN